MLVSAPALNLDIWLPWLREGGGAICHVSVPKGQRILLKLCSVPSTGTWVTFGGQISDEVGHRSPIASTLVTEIKRP